MVTLIRITDDTTADEIAEAIAHVNAHAKRLPHVTGLPHYATPWDAAHAQIDVLLDEHVMRA